eukprot:5719046-Pyramimonas_sp.AAC.1
MGDAARAARDHAIRPSPSSSLSKLIITMCISRAILRNDFILGELLRTHALARDLVDLDPVSSTVSLLQTAALNHRLLWANLPAPRRGQSARARRRPTQAQAASPEHQRAKHR